ncbi:predicted protein [Sclerotinia sclerotiorum 1980 UF-70]|uniref:Uncharacterized protein n=1 Tax=Sclerotinia sclerotiorum (strain ATCC 18683 / 1980 / Ss-1) TaxID=665079 RepID=A7F9G0_SCLS1|nr:predicted protein [Sclerotinia sclerotiorum 1980 UF-70]EDO00371.1 predicted protein [Sclerotinia sclerotiorum 1980 UF-70]
MPDANLKFRKQLYSKYHQAHCSSTRSRKKTTGANFSRDHRRRSFMDHRVGGHSVA